MKKLRKNSFVSRILAGVLAVVMVISIMPAIDVSAGDPGLIGSKSIVFNKATLYNYSDSYHRGDTLYEDDLIEGKGDYNADLRAKEYANNPNAEEWEGLYFGTGDKSTESVAIATVEVAKNLAKEFVSVRASSGDNEFKDGRDGLWNDNTQTKAWTTWISDGANGSTGYLRIASETAHTIKQIKLYFLDNENLSAFPSDITVKYGSDTYMDAADYIEMHGIETTVDNGNTYRTVTLDFDEAYKNVKNLEFTFGHPNNQNYVMLTEIELFDGVSKEIIATESVEKQVADYNVWAGAGSGETRAYVYTGLVQENLVNGQIQFNVPDGGLFTPDTSNKDIYSNVGVPFIYDMLTGYYEFNAGTAEQGGYGIHFDWDYDGVITPEELRSGSSMIIDGNHFVANDTVKNIDGIPGFFPFNSPQVVTEEEDSTTFNEQADQAVYHFGMNITIDFTMTKDGTSNGEGGEPVTFEFSGDDDVWVFIDGQLVLDLGGIHNSVSAKIDFAANEVTMWATDTAYGSGDLNPESGIGGNTEDGHVTNLGQILNSESGVGKIKKSRTTFAEEGAHTLTVYYLERGRTESNCKIRYNLPRVDTLDVTKQIELAEGETQAITEEEWTALNAIDFKMRVCADNGTPMTGVYALYQSNVYVGNYRTDENGYFTLKNNQTAKFTTPLGRAYRIEEVATETALPSTIWKSANWTGTFSSVLIDDEFGGIPVQLKSTETVNDETDETDIMVYPVSIETWSDAVDVLSVNCTNYISRPFVSVAGETVVIDYGLPVKIDIMGNDVQSSGKEFIIENITEPSYGKIRVLDADGNVVENYKTVEGYYYLEYTPTTYLSDMEKIVYTYKVVDSELSGGYAYPTGITTIIPATSMYYEENFLKADGTNYIKFSKASGFTGFTAAGTSEIVNQEPGVVGTLDDSTYGTDAAYLNNTGDSNGNSYKADTTNGPAAFQYEFTGTGTAFFARTSEKSGYLRVSLTDADGKNMLFTDEPNMYIDTKYAVTGKTLYNIPVFNIEGLPYNTYTVTVTIAKPSQWYTEQNEFYLDGVRVYNPIDMSDSSEYANFNEVYSAYETDLEADAQVNTLRNYMLDTQSDEGDEGEKVWKDTSQVMFTDSNSEIVFASEYESNGPKQELYMTSSQAIGFVLSNWFDDKPTNARLYLGAKVPEGSAGVIRVNNKEYTINNTVDCYYDITSAITVADESMDGFVKIEVVSGLISLTNLKCTGFVNFSLAGMDEIVKGPMEEQSVYNFLTAAMKPDPEQPEIDAEVVKRVAGKTRYETSLKVADELKEALGIEKFDTVILADGRNFPDALSGSYLAGKLQAPILMVNEKAQYSEPLRAYICSNMKKDGTIYVLGGTKAVPDEILNGLSEFNIKRLAGENRYETNLMILEEAGVADEDILVCTGKGFADSLSASATGKPILLVGKEIYPKQLEFLSRHRNNQYYVIGGTNAVSEEVETAVETYGKVKRLAGANRYETSVLVAEEFFVSPNKAVVAYAKNFPDGICVGPLAMIKNAPLLLISTDEAECASGYIEEKGIESGIVLGGTKRISEEIVNNVFGTF